MKRKEEINEQCFVNGFNDHDKEIFTIGVEWADSRPRKGLVDIEKACEWLEEHVREYKYYDPDCSDGNIDVDDLVYTFKKAMEE